MKRKQISVLLIMLTAVMSLMMMLPYSGFAEADNDFFNADSEAFGGGLFYYVDENGGIFSEASVGAEKNYLPCSSACRIGISGEYVYYSTEKAVCRMNADGSESSVLFSADEPISRFSKTGSRIYYLSGGTVYCFGIASGETSEVVPGTAAGDMWLDDASTLCYMTDGKNIFVIDLRTGEKRSRPNIVSDFDKGVPICEAGNASGGASPQKLTLTTLEEKFPSGKYWNHANNPGSSRNNQDGYTSTPCPYHGNLGSSTQTCNGFAPYGSQVSWQCMGYAEKCGYDVTGSNPRESGSWVTSYNSSKIDNVKAGDIVRYKNNEHSIYVIGVSGDTVTYTDCNSDNHCVIRWYANVSKSTLKASFEYIRIAPFDAGNYTVALNPNGGSCSETSVKIKYGETYGTLPVPVREGYNFDGWFTSASGGTKIEPGMTPDVKNVPTIYAHWTLIVYEIKYDLQGGTADNIKPQTKEWGGSVILARDNPKRTGYIFREWNTAADGSGTEYRGGNRYSANSSVVLYAQWEANKYSISFYPEGGYSPNGFISRKEVYYDSPIGELPEVLRDGYDFVGWYTKEGSIVTPDTIFCEPVFKASNTNSLYAIWTEKMTVITFDANGGSGAPGQQTKKYRDSVSLSSTVPTRTGFTFDSWNTSPSGGGTTYRPGETYSKEDNVTLYAMWTRDTYRVTYNANGGSGAPSEQTKEYGIGLSLSSAVPSRTGYKFSGWSTSASSSSVKYSAGSVYTGNSALSLYAVWEPVKSKVTFDPGDGVCQVKSAVVTYDGKYSLPVPTLDGNIFGGWETASGMKIADGQKVAITSDITVIAKWTPETYSVEFNANGGENAPAAQTKTYGKGLALTSDIPQKDGFTFDGWNTSADGGGKSYQPGFAYDEDESTVLYAQWKKTSYTVSYSADGGKTVSTTLIKNAGEDITAAAAPAAPEHYEFTGWKCGDKIYQPGDKYSENSDALLIASFRGKKFSLTLTDSENGTVKKDIYYGEKLGELPEYTSSESVFLGWTDASSFVYFSDYVLKEEKDLDLVSSWEKKSELSLNGRDTAVFVDASGELKKVFYNETGSGISVSEPEVTQLDGYTGEWQEYELTPGGTVVRAVYKPTEYTVTFTADEKTVAEVGFFEGINSITEPEVPDKPGYSGKWESYELKDENITVSAVYEAETYEAVFSAGDTAVKVPYSEGKLLGRVPDIPGKDGYSGRWSEYELTPGGVTVCALYDLESYDAVFVSEGKEVAREKYNIKTTAITVPNVPDKKGHSGRWSDYDFVSGGITVNALYTPNTYTVTFAADGNKVGSETYTYGDASVNEPDIPQKNGYTSAWSAYSLSDSDQTVTAVYTPIEYTATFIADGVIVDTVTFTVESKSISEPDIPEKEGYEASWDYYKLTCSDIVIKAVYSRDYSVRIEGYRSFAAVDYGSLIRFKVDAPGFADEGVELHWFINGVDQGVDDGDGMITVEGKNKYTISAKIIRDGIAISESETETVVVYNSLLNKIKWLFRKLFRRVPLYIQDDTHFII